MKIEPNDINLIKLSANQFEELCFELIRSLDFIRIIWRKGGADDGRDIEANRVMVDPFTNAPYEEKWFFECKKYSGGVPAQELYSKIVWAIAEKVDHYVFFITSHLSNSSRGYLEKIRSKHPFRISVIEGDELKQVLINNASLLHRFNLVSGPDKALRMMTDQWVIYNEFPGDRLISYLLNEKEIISYSEQEYVLLYSLFLKSLDEYRVASEARYSNITPYFEMANGYLEELFDNFPEENTPGGIDKDGLIIRSGYGFAERIYKYIAHELFYMVLEVRDSNTDVEYLYTYLQYSPDLGLETLIEKSTSMNYQTAFIDFKEGRNKEFSASWKELVKEQVIYGHIDVDRIHNYQSFIVDHTFEEE